MQLTSIVIPNRNGVHLLRLCIESIKARTRLPYEIIVVDNGSNDGSLEYCRQEKVRIVSLPFNRGFPAACNFGLKIASGDALMLLNNDVVVTRNWLPNLLRCLYSADDVGIVGPVSNYASGLQQVDSPFNTPQLAEQAVNEPNPGQWMDAKRLVGFCFLFKRELMNRIGLLDERFSPGHYEDDDYCYRARLAGYKLKAAGDAYVFHHGSASFSQEGQERLNELVRANREKFIAKWNVDPAQFI